MNILYLDHTSQMGGAEHNLYDLVAQLDRTQVKAHIVTTKDGPLGNYFEEINIPVSYFEMSARTQYTSREELQASPLQAALTRIPDLLSIRQQLRQILSSYPAQLVQTNSLKAHILGSLAVWGMGIPLIWHLQDLITQRGDNRRLLDLFARLVKPSIVCISEAVKRDLTPFMQTLATVIPNGTDVAKLHQKVTKNDIRAEFSIAPESVLVGMIGHLIPWKGHRVLLQAAQQLRGQPIYFLCVGGEILQFKGQLAELQQEAKTLGVEQHVIFTGMRRDISDILQAIDLLALPSEHEPFGRVLIEAMAFSKPIVATRGGGVPEIVLDQKTGILVPVGNATALAQAVQQVASDPKWATQLGSQGRQRVEQEFTLQAMAQRFIHHYRAICNVT